jgi:hypothetical protein
VLREYENAKSVVTGVFESSLIFVTALSLLLNGFLVFYPLFFAKLCDVPSLYKNYIISNLGILKFYQIWAFSNFIMLFNGKLRRIYRYGSWQDGCVW